MKRLVGGLSALLCVYAAANGPAHAVELYAEGTTLFIVGTADHDVCTVDVDPRNPRRIVVRTSTWQIDDSGVERRVDIQQRRFNWPTAIVFAGDAGHDSFTNRAPIPCWADGGEGDDTLTGGPADDTLEGGPGADALHGREGNDLLDPGADAIELEIIGGPGADMFIQWGHYSAAARFRSAGQWADDDFTAGEDRLLRLPLD